MSARAWKIRPPGERYDPSSHRPETGGYTISHAYAPGQVTGIAHKRCKFCGMPRVHPNHPDET